MESTTPFDLNSAIQQWRKNLAQAPSIESENLDELESHLCDSITALEARGLSPEEAFIIATRRVGHGGKLDIEFGKINPDLVWVNRILWMLVGDQILGFAKGLGNTVGTTPLALAFANFNYNYDIHGVTLPVILLSLAGLLGSAASLGLCWWIMVRNGERLTSLLAPLLQRRLAPIGLCTALCILLLAANWLGFGMMMWLGKHGAPRSVGSTMVCLSYSSWVTMLIQTVGIMIATLALARRQLRTRKGFQTVHSN